MSERWNLQFRNGILFGFVFIIIELVMSAFADSNEDEISELIIQPHFYLKWLIWFATGMFVIGYIKWKFPLRQEQIENQVDKEDNKGKKRNYIINYVVLFVFAFGILFHLDDIASGAFRKVIFGIIFLTFSGVILGYIEWKNVDGKYNSWLYLFKRIKAVFKNKPKKYHEL